MKSMKNLFSNNVSSSISKCEERKNLPTVPKLSPQNCVFYRIEIRGTVLKQPIIIEYLIKQKPRGVLALQVNRIAEKRVIQKGQVASYSFFLQVSNKTIYLVAELNYEVTNRKKFQVFKNVSFDSRAIAVVSGIALFCYDMKYKAVFTVLKFFYLAILTFKKSLVLAIRNITEVHFQECGNYF